MKFTTLQKKLLHRRIKAWYDDTIILDNGIVLIVRPTDNCDYGAGAWAKFSDVQLDAAITHVSPIKATEVFDGDEGYEAEVTIMHNQNVICRAQAHADGGSDCCATYYSIVSFYVILPDGRVDYAPFVDSTGSTDLV